MNIYRLNIQFHFNTADDAKFSNSRECRKFFVMWLFLFGRIHTRITLYTNRLKILHTYFSSYGLLIQTDDAKTQTSYCVVFKLFVFFVEYMFSVPTFDDQNSCLCTTKTILK